MHSHTFSTRVGVCQRGGGREAVVGLVLDERPDREAGGGERVFEQIELAAQRGVDARAGLVARVEIVAERLDHVVRGDTDVRGAALEHPQHRPQHTTCGRDLAALSRDMRRDAEVMAEQLVGAVKEVDVHVG